MSSALAEVESRPFFRRTLWKRTGYLALALVLDVLVLAFIAALHVDLKPHPQSVDILGYHVYLAYDRPASYFWLVAIVVAQVVLAHYAFRKSLDAPGMISLFPEDKSERRKFGTLSSPQLVQMVHELAGEMAVGPVKRIIVSDRPDPNAYTAHALGLGNVVVLHANLIEIMPPACVRAVVAHEVAHIRRRDSLIYMLLGFPRSFIVLLGAFVLWKVGVGIVWFDDLWMLVQRVLFLALVWYGSTWLLSRLGRIANLASQQSEYLADASAAAVCGVEPTLNALLLLGERSEALTVLQETLAKQPHLKEAGLDGEQVLRILRRFPPLELDHKKAKLLASRLYIEERLDHLKETLCVPFAEEEIVDLARRADVALRAKQQEEAEKDSDESRKEAKAELAKEHETEKLLLDWRKYDRDRSGHLDMQETAILVKALREDPSKMIFRQFLEPEAVWQSHPTMRDRVIFLYDAFRPGSA